MAYFKQKCSKPKDHEAAGSIPAESMSGNRSECSDSEILCHRNVTQKNLFVDQIVVSKVCILTTPFINRGSHPDSMAGVIINKFGEVEIDPYDSKGKHEKWLESISANTPNPDYLSFKEISPQASEYITKYVLDLHNGKNLARGTRKGRRSYNHLSNTRMRLNNIIRIIETRYKKHLFQLTENDILFVFNSMRDGTLLNKNGTPHLCVSSYAKAFRAFWRWIVRVKKIEDELIADITDSLDTSADRKPKWHYFTIQDVEKMGDQAKSIYYKALVYFLFDSGVRSPKELMNVRAMDITPVPNTEYLFLNVRSETSKTFGRKIKLMICSDILKKYIKQYKRKGADFLFPHTYVVTHRVVARMAYDALGVGEKYKISRSKILIRNGVRLYDFRHNSVCHYLPIYKSENQMKYRYGWKSAEMIHYYSEYLGMKDTITDDDMLIDTTKSEIQQQLQKEQNKVAILQEQMNSQRTEMEERLKQLEKAMLQKFADTM